MIIRFSEVLSKNFQDVYNIEDKAMFSSHDNFKSEKEKKRINKKTKDGS